MEKIIDDQIEDIKIQAKINVAEKISRRLNKTLEECVILVDLYPEYEEWVQKEMLRIKIDLKSML